jgi:CDP-glucose 4,6-dehydratase
MHFETSFRDARVLVTGHTGFKGAWLSQWLHLLGAKVMGVSLPPPDDRPSLFADIGLANRIESRFVDIRDASAVATAMRDFRPEVVFHLAAQALVRESYARPLETFATNILGTANILQAAGETGSVKSLVCVTTDKVYHNREWVWPYRETDELGGHDPYSGSKAAAEIVASVYRDNLWANDAGPRMATARGGNVIGGGDWSKDRLIPDIVRCIMSKSPLIIRSPKSIRPWQHVLELCRGYIVLSQRLAASGGDFSSAWNFGPGPAGEANVETVIALALKAIGRPDHPVQLEAATLRESRLLRLDISKATADLGWRPIADLEDSVSMTMNWYRRWIDDPGSALATMSEQIREYDQRLSA